MVFTTKTQLGPLETSVSGFSSWWLHFILQTRTPFNRILIHRLSHNHLISVTCHRWHAGDIVVTTPPLTPPLLSILGRGRRRANGRAGWPVTPHARHWGKKRGREDSWITWHRTSGQQLVSGLQLEFWNHNQEVTERKTTRLVSRTGFPHKQSSSSSRRRVDKQNKLVGLVLDRWV